MNEYKIIGWDVDTQRDFMENGNNPINYIGKLAVLDENGKPQGAMHLEKNLGLLIQYLRTKRFPQFGSIDWHEKNAKEFAENPDFQITFPQHCIKRTYGAENIDITRKLDPLYVNYDFQYNDILKLILKHTGEVVFRKDNFDVFATDGGNPHLKKVIPELGIKKVIVYGVATDVCVNYAVQGFRNLGVEVYAVEDAMAGVTPNAHKKTIEAWRNQEGINVIKLEDLVGLELR